MIKNYLNLFFFFLLPGFTNTLAAQTKTVYDQLLYVNKEWGNQPDAEPALKKQPALPVNEQELVRLHLQETETLLRKRKQGNLSSPHWQNRLKNLAVLHEYWKAGVFPANTLHSNRQPYFIDDNNRYCAVGYLMKMSGADDMAKAIHATQNFSYLADIHHPDLMNWVENAGLTFGELALIQPTYINDRSARVLEFHYNNIGTDVGEYIEFQQPTGFSAGPVGQILFYNENGVLYKTLPVSQMQPLTGQPDVIAYTFLPTDSFANKGSFELRNATGSVLQQLVVYNDVSVTTTTLSFSPAIQSYTVGENETTPVGSSLSYCGHTFGGGFYNDLTLQILPATPGTVNSCLILPVSLTGFTYATHPNSIDLIWQTASETNTHYFEIQRSSNGVDFKTIGKIQAARNSNSIKNYAFTDNNPEYINHYRLKQVDQDGKFTNSKILFVKLLQANPLIIVQNPVKQTLQIQLNGNQPNTGEITIYDFTGRLVKRSNGRSGTQNIDVSHFATGKYLVRLNTKDGQVYSRQFVKE